jgi:hypothetical protein
MKVLVVYSHYGFSEYQENLKFFQDFGMYQERNIDYILVVNGDNFHVEKSKRWKEVLFRENKGYDFGA